MASPHQQKKAKKIKKNVAGAKPKWFAQMVNEITKDTTASAEELTAKLDQTEEIKLNEGRIEIKKDKLPEGLTVVETLHGHWVFNDSRLMRHIDTIHAIQKEFSEDFWDLENGDSIMELRVDRKNRVWADDQTILHFVYLMLAMNLAVWSYTREEWKNLKEKMPYIKFTSPKRGEENGETNV